MARTPATYFIAAGQNAFTAEERTSQWARQFAFGALEPTAQVFRAEYTRLANAYQRPANLANVNINGAIAYFSDDVSFRDLGGNVQQWTRELATLPANFTDAESYPYAFPGYYLGRNPFTRTITSKLQHEFFLIGNTALGASYNTQFEIPQTQAQNYAWAYIGRSVSNVVWTPLDGYLANTQSNLFLVASVPNLANYQGWVTTDNSNASSFSLEVQDSVLTHYSGPIWKRTRRFVKAR